MAETLRTCPLGVEVEICRMDFEARSRFRLNELGFRVHEPVRVIQKAMFGGCVVAHGGERIAIDGATARHIFVSPRTQTQKPTANIG
ncbi:ferrous iron transport protein A [Bifidobacterium sp. ESL0798]|uniref:FeoA family protein n=1 Tax=Bifidobacterium sp. ESL0798 TaxID=2983235 RepID=UPI0023F65110|nr:ferrous iron transport protein A [Bifidobacterium sp. ESL0798]WEV74027.1 ferrous iron transport protein A [Bifidobacterium sp. ESL0798]